MLAVSDISKSFDGTQVLRDIDLEVAAGEFVVLLGPSGCGKTTLLRVIAGLEIPDVGQVQYEGKSIASIPSHRRGFGMVFQEFALFPHLDVSRNVSFGLEMLGWRKERIDERVRQALAWVGLEGKGNRAVYDLSGGERQRVALARALAPAPRLLLLDEPLGSLDRALRDRLVGDLRPILQQAVQDMKYEAGIAVLYVTHDQAEAFALGDRVAVMRQGRIEQVAPPRTLYGSPATPFVARFLGMENIIDGELDANDPDRVQTGLGSLIHSNSQDVRKYEESASIKVLLRPDAASREALGVNPIDATVEQISFRGRYQIVTLTSETDYQLRFEMESDETLPEAGKRVRLWLRPAGIQILRLAHAE